MFFLFFFRFFYQLVIIYELYTCEFYKDSLLAIRDVIKSLDTRIFDESDEPYFYACHHISWATYGYIALTLNHDCENVSINYKARVAIIFFLLRAVNKSVEGKWKIEKVQKSIIIQA